MNGQRAFTGGITAPESRHCWRPSLITSGGPALVLPWVDKFRRRMASAAWRPTPASGVVGTRLKPGRRDNSARLKPLRLRALTLGRLPMTFRSATAGL